jgi:hypothetical protein
MDARSDGGGSYGLLGVAQRRAHLQQHAVCTLLYCSRWRVRASGRCRPTRKPRGSRMCGGARRLRWRWWPRTSAEAGGALGVALALLPIRQRLAGATDPVCLQVRHQACVVDARTVVWSSGRLGRQAHVCKGAERRRKKRC